MEPKIVALILIVILLVLLIIIIRFNIESNKKRKLLNASFAEQRKNIEYNYGTVDPTNPHYGVKGWLKFFIVVNLYISPVIFVLYYIVAWIGFSELAEDYPGIISVGAVETGVGGFFVLKWMQIAQHLNDIRPGVIQEAKFWLKVALGWSILDAMLVFLTGMDAEDLLPGAIKGIVTRLIAFAIWYSFFNVSRRVQATYPDWNK